MDYLVKRMVDKLIVGGNTLSSRVLTTTKSVSLPHGAVSVVVTFPLECIVFILAIFRSSRGEGHSLCRMGQKNGPV